MNEKGTDILQQYDLDIIRTSRVRGAILCETRQGVRLLKEYRGSATRLEQVQRILTELEENTAAAVDKVIPNREGEWISLDSEQVPYIVKEWNSGRECDLSDDEEVLRGVRLLASLHRALRQSDSQGFKKGDSLIEEYRRHTAELKRARGFVRHVRHKSEFELCMMESFGHFFGQAEEAMELLESQSASEALKLPESGEDREASQESFGCASETAAYLCHGEYSHHHILYDGEFAMVTDFMGMHLGPQASDLYYFMRKTMEKQGFCRSLGERMLCEYDRLLSLDQTDRRYLYIRFLYPEKYWKQVNYYYNSNKAWIPARNTEKLKILEEQEPERGKFLDFLRQGVI